MKLMYPQLSFATLRSRFVQAARSFWCGQGATESNDSSRHNDDHPCACCCLPLKPYRAAAAGIVIGGPSRSVTTARAALPRPGARGSAVGDRQLREGGAPRAVLHLGAGGQRHPHRQSGPPAAQFSVCRAASLDCTAMRTSASSQVAHISYKAEMHFCYLSLQKHSCFEPSAGQHTPAWSVYHRTLVQLLCPKAASCTMPAWCQVAIISGGVCRPAENAAVHQAVLQARAGRGVRAAAQSFLRHRVCVDDVPLPGRTGEPCSLLSRRAPLFSRQCSGFTALQSNVALTGLGDVRLQMAALKSSIQSSSGRNGQPPALSARLQQFACLDKGGPPGRRTTGR